MVATECQVTWLLAHHSPHIVSLRTDQSSRCGTYAASSPPGLPGAEQCGTGPDPLRAPYVTVLARAWASDGKYAAQPRLVFAL